MKKKKVESEVYVDECPYCGLEVAGTAESQVKFNLKLHKQQKHPKEYNKEKKEKKNE